MLSPSVNTLMPIPATPLLRDMTLAMSVIALANTVACPGTLITMFSIKMLTDTATIWPFKAIMVTTTSTSLAYDFLPSQARSDPQALTVTLAATVRKENGVSVSSIQQKTTLQPKSVLPG